LLVLDFFESAKNEATISDRNKVGLDIEAFAVLVIPGNADPCPEGVLAIRNEVHDVVRVFIFSGICLSPLFVG